MAKDSQDSQLHELGTLITVARQHEGKIPGIRPYRVKLEKAYLDALTARSTRDSLIAETRKATRRLRGTLTAAKEAALRLRSYARGTLGPRNEQLTCFGVAPLKKRRPPRPDELDAAPAKAREDAA
jgi:hypothetical protein